MGVDRPRSVAPLQSVRKRGLRSTFFVVVRSLVARDAMFLCMRGSLCSSWPRPVVVARCASA